MRSSESVRGLAAGRWGPATERRTLVLTVSVDSTLTSLAIEVGVVWFGELKSQSCGGELKGVSPTPVCAGLVEGTGSAVVL